MGRLAKRYAPIAGCLVCLTLVAALAGCEALGAPATEGASGTITVPARAIRNEVPLDLPASQQSNRRRAFEDCHNWAQATLRQDQLVESDRGLAQVIGGDYQAFAVEDSAITSGRARERLTLLLDRCMASSPSGGDVATP